MASARASYQTAVLNYDNAIKDAQLQNNSLLAEIAYNSLQQQLQLSLEGFQYKNQLILEMAKEKRTVEESYYKRYQDVLAQINHENALAEEARQADLANERQQEQIKIAQDELKLQQDKFSYEKEQASKATYTSSKSGSSGSSGSGGSLTPYSGNKKAATTTTTTTTKKNVKSDTANKNMKLQVNLGSVLKLGLGPISESKLNDMVKAGYLKEIRKGGMIEFQWTAAGLKQQMVYQQSTQPKFLTGGWQPKL